MQCSSTEESEPALREFFERRQADLLVQLSHCGVESGNSTRPAMPAISAGKSGTGLQGRAGWTAG